MRSVTPADLIQMFNGLDDKTKLTVAWEILKWAGTTGLGLLRNRNKKAADSIQQALIHTATLDDVKQYDPAYHRLVHVKRVAKKVAMKRVFKKATAKRVVRKTPKLK